jgi:oligopeptide transport system substrate-binding protein
MPSHNKEKFLMRTSKKSVAAIFTTLLVVMAVMLSACGGAQTPAAGTKAAADKQNLTLPLPGISDVKTLDPPMVTTSTSNDVVSMVYTGLVSLDKDQKVVPELADSWTTSSDGLTWTFKLKPNLKFSDGTPLTSTDVVYSINRALTPALASPAAPSYLNLVKDSDKMLAGKVTTLIGDSLLAPDANTVVIVINKPVSYFLATLTYPTADVVEKSLIDKYGNTKFTDHLSEGGGSGPFKVKSYTHGKSIVLVPNSNYVKNKPILTVTWNFYKDSTTAYQAYQNGQLDLANVPTAYLSQVQNSSEFHKTPELAIFYYGMNYLTKPFDNIKIRQAFELAINKTQVVSTVYKNVYTPTNHIIPAGMPGYDTNLKGPDGTTSTSGNATLAKQLFTEGLKEEGYASAAALPKIQFPYASGSPDEDKEISIVVQEWKDVLGVTVQAAPTDFETLSASLPQNVGKTTISLFQTGWIQDYPDPQDFSTLQFAPNQPNNQTNYGQNKSSDAATQVKTQQTLAAADVEKDQTKRFQMYNDAEQQLVNDVVWIPMYQENNPQVVKSYVKNFEFTASGLVSPSDWSLIYITNH